MCLKVSIEDELRKKLIPQTWVVLPHGALDSMKEEQKASLVGSLALFFLILLVKIFLYHTLIRKEHNARSFARTRPCTFCREESACTADCW